MNTENSKWVSQTQSLIFTPTALLKLVGVSLIWHMIGIPFVFINFGIFIFFILVFFGILWFFPYWQPAYSIIYRIVGNKNISPTLEPHKLNWWQFISLGIRLLFLAYLLYVAIILLMK